MATIQEYMDYYAKQYGLDAPSQAPAVAPIDYSKVPVPAPAPQELEGGVIRDTLVSGAKGVIGAGEALVGLANIPTLGQAGKGLEAFGYRPEEAKSILNELYSPKQKALQTELAGMQGFMPTAEFMLRNPSTIYNAIVESAPATLLGGGIARGVTSLAPKLSAIARAGIGEGAVGAGMQAENIRQQTESRDLTPEQVGYSALTGLSVGTLGAVGGKAAKALGVPDIDVVLAGGGGLTGNVPGYLKRVIGAGLVEGVFQELPQSASEQAFANLALGKPVGQGVAEAAAQGMLAGIGMGSGFSALQFRVSDPAAVPDQDLIDKTDTALFGQVPPPPVAAPTPAPMAPPVVDVRGQTQIPGVPAAPVSPQDVTTGQDRPFAGTPDTELRRTLRALEERAVSGQASSRDMNLMRIVQAELEQREGMAPAGMDTRTGTLFDENARFERRGPEARRPEAEDVNARLAAAAQQAPAQQEQPLAGITPAPAEQGLELPVTEQARQQRVQQMRALAKQLGGGRDTQFTKKLNAQNETELTAAVIAELERGTSSNQIMQLAEGLGIIDANGQPRDFDREVQVAQQQLANAQRAATSPFENAEQLTAAREQIAVAERNLAEVQRRRDVVNAALTPQQAPEQEAANAVQEPRPTEVDVRQPTQDGGKMAERNTKKQASARKGKKQEVAPKDAPAVERAIDGVSTPALVLAVEQNNLQAALQEMIDDKTNAYTDLEKLVARRLLMAKSLPNIEIVKAENMVPEKDGSIPAARYFVEDDTIRIVEGEADSHIVLHEAIHAFLHSRIKAFERGDFFSQNLSNLQKLFQYLQKNNPELASQYAFTNLSEFASEAMSNREFQEQLRDIPYQRQSVFTWFAQQVMKLLGINQNQASNALAAAMISVEGDMISGREMQTAITGAASTEAPASMQRITAPQTREVLGNFQTVTNVADAVKEKLQNVPYADMGVNLFRGILGWQTKFNLVAGYDKVLNGALQLNIDADNIQEATAARFNQMFNEPYHKLEALERSNPKAFETVHELMAATAYQIDPRKTWEEHGHLQKLEGRKLAQAKKDVAEYRQKWGRLPEDVQQIYTDLSTMNEAIYTAERAVQMYNLVRANEGAKNLPEFTLDPTAEFRATAEAHGSPQAAQRYWRGVLETYLVAVDQFVDQQRGLLPQKAPDDPEYVKAVKTALKNVTDPKIRNKIRAQLRVAQDAPMTDLQKAALRHLSPLESHARAVRETIATFNQAPYFHLGRFGEQYVSFRVKMLEDGTADPAAMEIVQERLRDRFDMVTMRKDGLDPHVFARFESVDQSQAFVNELRKLQAEGYLMQVGEKDKNNRDLGAIVSGTRKQVLENYTSASTKWLDQFIETVQAEGYPDDVAQRIIAHARSMYLDSLPDTAAIKIQQRREGRPGWNSDMIRSYAHRMRIGANKISSLAAQPVRTDSFATMNDAYAQMETNPNVSESAKAKARAVIDEFERRDKDRADMPSTPGIDQLRAINHAYFLGLSPSYVFLQMTQLGVLTWPELVKTNGAVRSAKVLAQVTPLAFNVLRQVVKEGYQTRGIKGATDFVITADTLKRSGLTASDAQFLTEIMASGKLDIGNFAREMMRVIEGDAQGDINEKMATALKVASSFGYMSETATRIISALAAKRMYDSKKHAGMSQEQYAIRIIDESMLNYNHQNIGRMTGKKGFAGTLTPVMLSFMQYQFQLLEKLYREMYNAISSDPKISAAQRTEARRFLGAHLSAMMVLAGSLGLPFATVIAKAADELCELFSDGPCDSKAALRNYTADVFGSDIEAMINRGIVPRALGFDITQRAGEADILPFSRFLADKRAMDERIKDLTADSWGAPTSMVANILTGFEKVAQGDLAGGLQTALPIAVRGPVNAYALTQKGYVDQSGNKLPMDAGAYDMMIQSVGLTPGELADYRQARMVQAQRVGVLTREATLIRQKLATAYENQDREAAAKWFKEAQKFDARNPQSPILPTLGSTLMQRAKARTLAENFGTPLGVRPQDVEGRELTRFFQP